jgi:transposase InsO family protein
MLLHGCASLNPFHRAVLRGGVREDGLTVEEVIAAAGRSERVAYRWSARHDAGEPMLDPSSAPHRRPAGVPAKIERQVERLRRLRWTSTKIVAAFEMAVSTIGFLERAIAWFAARGVRVCQVMSDNGSAHQSAPFALWCSNIHVEHIRTRQPAPDQRKSRTAHPNHAREWAYVATYRSSTHRRHALPARLDYHNHERPHSALGHEPTKRPSQHLTNATGIHSQPDKSRGPCGQVSRGRHSLHCDASSEWRNRQTR